MDLKTIDNVNIISDFLAVRDIDKLDKNELLKKYNIQNVDILILLGNSILYTIEVAAKAYKNGICNKLMIAGGIGHATKILVENVKNNERFKDIDTDGKAEADIFLEILKNHYGIDEDNIIVENKSTNCGSNAIEALKVLKQRGNVPKNVILIQDPTMQRRTYEAFKYIWKNEDTKFINYAPFIPKFTEQGVKELHNQTIDGIWNNERFLSLIMGEIPRLTDDKNGYGPKGHGFIGHVDIPYEVLKGHEHLKEILSEYLNMRS